jgi:hypothetical protein
MSGFSRALKSRLKADAYSSVSASLSSLHRIEKHTSGMLRSLNGWFWSGGGGCTSVGAAGADVGCWGALVVVLGPGLLNEFGC